MLNLDELHYLIAATGAGLFLTAGCCVLFNHGWRNIYRWYIFLLFYAALTFLVHVPLVDAQCIGWGSIVRELFTAGLVPMTMATVGIQARQGKGLVAFSQVATWIGLAAVLTAIYAKVPALVGWAGIALMGSGLVAWCVTACRHFWARSGDRWLAYFAIFLVLYLLGLSGVRLLLPWLHLENLALVGQMMAYLPTLLVFQYHMGGLDLFATQPSSR